MPKRRDEKTGLVGTSVIAQTAIDRDNKLLQLGEQMERLLKNLDQFAPTEEHIDLNRKMAIKLLKIISDFLDHPSARLLDTDQNSNGDDAERVDVYVTHPAMSLLKEFIGCLADLDNGKPSPIFKSAAFGPNASLTSKELEIAEVWLQTVNILLRTRNFASRRQAEIFFAEKLRQHGKTWKHKPVTAKLLKSLRDRADRRKDKNG